VFIDEMAIQHRDLLALHLASDPSLGLDVMVFTLADADMFDWRARAATTLRGPVSSGPIIGFEAKDAPASAALAELRSGLDETWPAR
jgi:ParB family chromosome partitioning protein